MKIALEMNSIDLRDGLLDFLAKRDFKIDTGSFSYILWVYDLVSVDFDACNNAIKIKKDTTDNEVTIDLDDVDHFEVRNN